MCIRDRDYATLDAEANRLAHWLRAQGVGRGTLVAICLQRSVRAIATVLGIMKSGGAYVPLDPAYPEQRIAAMLADARPALVLADAPSREMCIRDRYWDCGVACTLLQR